MTSLPEIWIFDIDGVITDPSTKTITSPRILRLIEQKLADKIPVFFNTGRSSEWVQKEIIPHFDPKISLEQLFTVCEMGNLTLEFNQDNSPQEIVVNRNLIPPQLESTIRDIVQSSYGDSMFVDETKKTILTIEMKDNYAQALYEELQSKLSGEIRIILKNYHPGIHVRPSSSNIAIDVKPIDSNKALGITQVLSWLKAKKITLSEYLFVAFGDSTSDLQMSEFLESEGLHTKFVYVGGDDLNVNPPYPLVKTKLHFTQGTLEYLES